MFFFGLFFPAFNHKAYSDVPICDITKGTLYAVRIGDKLRTSSFVPNPITNSSRRQVGHSGSFPDSEEPRSWKIFQKDPDSFSDDIFDLPPAAHYPHEINLSQYPMWILASPNNAKSDCKEAEDKCSGYLATEGWLRYTSGHCEPTGAYSVTKAKIVKDFVTTDEVTDVSIQGCFYYTTCE